jgi:hypothetical protein
MSRKPRKKINHIITSDTIYFDHNEGIESTDVSLYSNHLSVAEQWIDGLSIWSICQRFNIRVPEAEAMVRYGVKMIISAISKRKTKTGRKSSKKKQPSA